MSFGPDVLPQLKPYLLNEDGNASWYMLEVFSRVGGEFANQELLALARIPTFGVGTRALKALSTMKPPPDEFWSLLSSSLKSRDPGLQATARLIRTELNFSQLAPAGPQRLEQLKVLSRSQDHMDRNRAVKALGEMAPGMPEARPLLIRALRDPDLGVRKEAVAALARLKQAVPEAVKPLSALTKDPHPPLQIEAIAAILEIDQAAARRFIPVLRRHIAKPSPAYHTASEASALLARLGDLQDAGRLGKAMGAEKDSAARRRIIWSIGELGQPHPEAIAALAKALHSADTVEFVAAAQALGKLGPKAVPALLRVLEPGNTLHSRDESAVIEALGAQISAMPERIIPPLLARLERDTTHSLEYPAAQTLQQAGAAARQRIVAWAALGPVQLQYAKRLKSQMSWPDQGLSLEGEQRK
ncbi:MAG TPA: HEAT repeat domain-containing protein [Myxococcaceae bacterium]